MYNRLLNLNELLKIRSYFLLGPRGTGKSTLINQTLPNAKIYDLLDASIFQRLLRDPTLISQETEAQDLVVIDEIQKLPELLDEVQRLIVKRKQRFLLTGSSARKWRKRGAHLNILLHWNYAHIFHISTLTFHYNIGEPLQILKWISL